MENANKLLWEILVPRYSNSGVEYDLEHHRKWDELVRGISGGLTILKSTKGQWVDFSGNAQIEEMIPVRIYCNESDIEKISRETIKHYDQDVVMVYTISDKVKMISKKER